MPRSRHRSSHSIARRWTCGRSSNACTTLCSTGRPDSEAISSRCARSWRMSDVVSVTCCTPWFRSARTPARMRHVSSCITSVGIGVPSQSRCTAAGPLGGRRCADQPHPPASIDSCNIRASSGVLRLGRQPPRLRPVEPEHVDEHRADRHVRQDVQRLRRRSRARRGTPGTSPSPTASPGASTRTGSPRPGSSSASRTRAARAPRARSRTRSCRSPPT